MTVVFEQKTGWGMDHCMSRYASSYADIFSKAKGTMKFFDGDVSKLFDAYIRGNNDLAVVTYPHTFKGIDEFASKNEERIRRALQGKNPTPMIIEDGLVRPLTPDDFELYYPRHDEDDEAFIFLSKNSEIAFPHIFIYTKEQKISNRDALKVAAESSSAVYDTVGLPTTVGKRFLWSMIMSRRRREYVPVGNVDTNNLKFPTNGRSQPSHGFSIKALEAFAETCDAKNILVTQKGMSYNDLEDGEVVDDPDYDEHDQAVFGKPPAADLMNMVLKEAAEIDMVNLSDIYELGIGKVISKMPFTDRIIDVNLDMPAVATKMCIFEGLVHLIPVDKELDVATIFGEPDELFRICTEESLFPKRMLPAPKTDTETSTTTYVH